jgi:hypothetical protein
MEGGRGVLLVTNYSLFTSLHFRQNSTCTTKLHTCKPITFFAMKCFLVS